MDHELRHDPHRPDLAACPALDGAGDVDWIDAQAGLDDCDGYVVLAVDPQTGEVDAHGPYAGFGALSAAEAMRANLDREELGDVVVRVVRWHTGDPARLHRAA